MSPQLIGSEVNSEVGVVLPTYKEADNIAKLIDDIENLNLDANLLVIDDSSPDGTAEIVRLKQKQYKNITLYVRPEKTGLGTAITDGFKIFLACPKPPKYVFTMDADYSHNPQDIPLLLSAVKEPTCGIVIGSRYIKGGKIAGWPFSRKLVSKTANFLAKKSLGLKPKDCTSGYRCYSIEFLKQAISNLHSHTYEIQIETVRQAKQRNFVVKETPILFVNRKRGKSKLSRVEIRSFLSYTLKAVCRH
jgi:dolichol-phosphate mannosyltransferase